MAAFGWGTKEILAIIRGTADENGNISMYKEGYKLGQLSAAEARATGVS